MGLSSAQVAIATSGLGAFVRTANAAHHCDPSSWGGLVGNIGGWTCDNFDGFKILEIFLAFGSSQWESFWLPGSGAPNFSDYGMGSLPLNQMDWAANTADFPCQTPDIPPNFDNSQLFATDSNGGNIFWGAPARPLYQRPDILNRCRMITQFHELLPHEAAQPFTLSGLGLGNPRRAGTGAAIQRRARVVNPANVLPVSYVFHRNSFLAANSASVTGTHPGYARPVVIQIGDNDSFVNSLGRSGITQESDDLYLALRHEYRDRLRFRGAGDPVRSESFNAYWVAAELLKDAPAMQALFPGGMLVRDTAVATCPEHTGATAGNRPSMKTILHAAASLLSSTGSARYVCAIDDGIAGTYDTHGDGTQMHLLFTSANIYNVMHHLAEIIKDPVANPTGPLDLDETMVVINTEFNRTPGINASNGRDHWTTGYVSTFIGGPISGGPTIRGAIDSSGETVVGHQYSATDMRGAMLLAAGVDPFAEGNFRFGDFSDDLVTGLATEDQLRDRLRGQILGL